MSEGVVIDFEWTKMGYYGMIKASNKEGFA